MLEFSLLIFYRIYYFIILNNYKLICVCLRNFNIFYIILYLNNYKVRINKI